MRFDLHIHSCLSPCGDLEMSPGAIVERAVEMGLEGIALTDHNSARNTPALEECCKRAGLACLFGLEICTAEEVHVLALFNSVAEALDMTEWVYESLPKRVNQPEVFGDQPVVTADEEIIEMEWRLLAGASSHSLAVIGEEIRGRGGLYIACHVDRAVFSFFSQLGVVTGEEGFDAMELSRHAKIDEWRARELPVPLLRSSDAHYLADLGEVWSEAPLAEFTVEAIREQLRGGGVRLGLCG